MHCPECKDTNLSSQAQNNTDLCTGRVDVDLLIDGQYRETVRSICGTKLADLVMHNQWNPRDFVARPAVEDQSELIIDLRDVNRRSVA